MSSIQKVVSLIRVKRIRIVISTVKLITKITQSINSKYIKIVYSIKEIMKFIIEINIGNPIFFISKARQKIIMLLSNGFLSIVATAVYAVFYLLGEFDPQTLGTLDTEILGDMDYSLV